jgi:hypothetical protein
VCRRLLPISQLPAQGVGAGAGPLTGRSLLLGFWPMADEEAGAFFSYFFTFFFAYLFIYYILLIVSISIARLSDKHPDAFAAQDYRRASGLYLAVFFA